MGRGMAEERGERAPDTCQTGTRSADRLEKNTLVTLNWRNMAGETAGNFTTSFSVEGKCCLLSHVFKHS